MIETNLIEDFRLLSPPSYGWLAWLALGPLAVLIGWWIRRLRQLRPTAPSAGPNEPAAWEEALRELEHLAPLLRPDQSRAYGIASTAVLRRYVERRYGLRAPLLATEEFLVRTEQSSLLPLAHRSSLGDYLRLCDLMKFGRAVGEAEELQRLHAAAIEFVMATRPEPVPVTADGGPAEGRRP